jgi:predicted CoA-binding protein
MPAPNELVTDFLEQRHIAVAGVSRTKRDAANFVYVKLRNAGYHVYAVNPNATEVEGDPCYPDLRSLPETVDGLVIVTRPERANDLVQACAEAGVRRVWMHRAFGTGSVSDEAVTFCREHGISVIPGACPMMYCKPVDIPHRCMRWVLGVMGKLPR